MEINENRVEKQQKDSINPKVGSPKRSTELISC